LKKTCQLEKKLIFVRELSHKSQKSSATGIIVGSVIGGIAFIVLAALLVFFLMRRRRNSGNNNEGTRGESARSLTETRSNSIELRNSTYKTILNIEVNERLGGGAFSGNGYSLFVITQVRCV
jgi:ATP-dependent Zn protease